jgi:cytochrome c5
MRIKITILAIALAFISVAWCAAAARPAKSTGTILVPRNAGEAAAMRLEGERRFRANCNRCHAAPHKFPPRMMATIVRHMRVRATITDEDMRFVLFYLTQ